MSSIPSISFNMLLPSFVMFVREQDKSKTYDYMDNNNCAFAQFLKAQGYPDSSVGGSHFSLDNETGWLRDRTLFPYAFKSVLEHHEGNATFGALSQRLDMYLKQHPSQLVAGEL